MKDIVRSSSLTFWKAGLIFLCLCCVSYIIFWLNGYQPDKAYRRAQPLSIILFIVTFILGFAGVYLIAKGFTNETIQTHIKGSWIIISAVILYIVTAFITVHFFDRPVTTELLLITVWAAFMAELINVTGSGQFITGSCVKVSVILLILVYVVCMVLYVMYYRMEPSSAYWWAIVPLVAIALDMAVMIFML